MAEDYTRDEFSQAVRDALGQRKPEHAMRRAMFGAVDAQPDLEADLRKASKLTGVPLDSARAFPAEVKKRAQLEAIDYADVAKRFPRTAAFMGDPNNARLAHDDLPTFQGIEKTVGGIAAYVMGADGSGGLPGDIGRNVRAGLEFNVAEGFYGLAAAPFGVADSILQSIADTATALTGTKRVPIAGTPGPESYLLGLSNEMRDQSNKIPVTPEGAGFVRNSFMQGIRSGVQQVTALPFGMVGGPTAMLSVMGGNTFGTTYSKAREAGKSPTQASIYGLQDATAEVVTEKYLGAARLLADVKAGTPLARVFVRDILREIPGESAATVWQNFNEWLNLNPDKPVSEWLAEQPEDILRTAIATVAGGAVQTGAIRGIEKTIGMLGDQQWQAAKAQEMAAQIEQLQKLGAASKVLTRDADSLKAFVAQVADEQGDTPTEFYVDSKTLATTLNQSGMSMQELQAVAPAIAQQISQATTGDVRVPVSEFVALGEKVTAPLIDHIRTDAEAMTRKEAEEYLKTNGEEIRKQVESQLKGQDEIAAWQEGVDELTTRFEQEIAQTGRFDGKAANAYAKLLANFYGAQASRIGITPQEMAARYQVRVQGAGVAGARTMEQNPGVPADPNAPGQPGGAQGADSGKSATDYFADGASLAKTSTALARLFRAKKEGQGLAYGKDGNRSRYYLLSDGRRLRVSDHDAKNHRSAADIDIQITDSGAEVAVNRTDAATGVISSSSATLQLYGSGQQTDVNGRPISGWWNFDGDSAALSSALRGLIERVAAGEQAPDSALDSLMGEQSAPTSRGATLNQSPPDITQTETFRAWFGDSVAVQAVNAETGEPVTSSREPKRIVPLRMYHTTRNDFTSFAVGRETVNSTTFGDVSTTRAAIFVTPDVEASQAYGTLGGGFARGANVMPLYIKAENPLDLTDGVSFDVEDSLIAEGLPSVWVTNRVGKWDMFDDEAGKDFVAAVKRRGYDSVIFNDQNPDTGDSFESWAVFAPEQIKSAIGNRGTFSPTDANILNQDEAPRAQISLPADFKAGPAVISLLERADLSSFLHEGGHLFLEIQADLAIQIQNRIDSGEEVSAGERGIVEDMNRLLAWFGVKGIEQASGATGGALDQGSTAFAKWFGDSKVVDEKGQPLVVYHGSPDLRFMKEDATFKTQRERYGMGSNDGAFWFTPSQATAKTYANPVRAFDYQNAEEGVIATYLKLENPLVVDANGAEWRDAQRRGKTSDVMEEARAKGHDGVIIRNVRDDYNNSKRTKPTDTYVVFSSTQIKAVDNRGTYDPSDPNILNQGGEQDMPPADITPQGRTPLETWTLMSLEEKRAYHEQFARGFEAFAFEGKAPSIELQGVFQRFRSWLVNIYKTLKGLNVELNDDVRQVMGRMLATDRAIEEAEAQRAMGPLFRTAEEAGMTLEEFEKYQGLASDSTQRAVTELQTRSLKDMKWLSGAMDKALKRKQQEVEELRREIRAEVRMEVMREPVYRAWSFLTGKVAERGDEVLKEDKTRASKEVDVGADSLLVAIPKLGGISRESATTHLGVHKDDYRIDAGVFGKPVFRKEGGLSADAMREALTERGYLSQIDEQGQTGLPELEALIADEIGGTPRYSMSYNYGADREGVTSIPEGYAYGKLNTEVLKARYGRGDDSQWRKLSARRMVNADGLHPDVVAEQFGFDSGDAMVQALVAAAPPAQEIDARTDERMVQMFGDITSPEALKRAAEEAVHNELRARVIATELRALEKANKVRDEGRNSLYTRSTVDALSRAAKEYAQQIINRQRIRDLRPAQYTAAEARNAKLAQKALGGDLAEAAMHQRNRLINHHAARAAMDAQDEVKKSLEFFKKVNKGTNEDVAKTRDVAIVQAMRAVLADYGLGTKGKRAEEYLEAVKEYDPDTHAILADKVALLTRNATPYKDMMVEQLAGLTDELRGMWHLAKRTRKIEIDGKLIDRKTATAEIVMRLDEIGVPDRIPGEGSAVTDSERRLAKLQSFKAALRRVESWVRLKDGGDAGPFRRYVWQPVRDAADRYRMDKAKYLRKYRDLLAGMDLGRQRIEAPELGYTFGMSRGGSGKQEILHAILHTGNASNKRKLLLGRGWAVENQEGVLDTAKWDRFVKRMHDEGVLTQKDYDFAQGVWDLLEEIKPLAQATHRDVFGSYFAEVTAEEIDTPFGKYRGGYVPALADPEAVADAAVREMIEAESATMMQAFPTTNKGFTKGRVEYNRALLLDLRSLSSHIDKVLMFAHLEKPVRDVKRILGDRDVSDPLSRVDPAAYAGLLNPWLKRTALQIVETPISGTNGIMSFFARARARAGIASMFANLSNTAQQITGFPIAAVRVKPKYLLGAMAQWTKAPREMARTVAEASPYMATRMDNEVAQMTDAINDILLNPTAFEKSQAFFTKHAYFMQSAVDSVMSPIIWTAAYNEALEGGMDTNDARRIADGIVRQTQGSSLAEDVSRIETGNAFVRMFSQFYGYFNMQANLLGTEFAKNMQELGLRKGAGRALYIFTLGFYVPALVSEMIVQAFRGGPDDEDKDGETLDDWFAAVFGLSAVRGAVALVPVAGQIASGMINAANSKPYDDRLATSPAVSYVESSVRAPWSVYYAITEGASAKKAIRDLATLMTMLTGIPFTFAAKPVGYAADVMQGNVDPTGPVDAARGALTGVASPESK